jgi:4'-phosphopantetheinyl transferase
MSGETFEIPQLSFEMLGVTAAASLENSERDIHVWTVTLPCGPEELAQLRSTLATDEKSRADRFIAPQDRSNFISARGILRKLLGTYLRRDPSGLQFEYGMHGKPFLQGQTDTSLRFSLSHSHGIAAYAIARDRNLGIDVELVREGFRSEEIAERYFSAQEREALRCLPAWESTEGFFNCWTRKEAFLKAVGSGLQTPLDSFDVTVAPQMPARFLRGVGAEWHLEGLVSIPGYAAAVAYDGPPCEVRHLGWIHTLQEKTPQPS